jgi:Restriction endonuclease/Novel STAND NTPase 1
MFFMVNFEGETKSAVQDKGKLFERLVGELVEHLGYQDIELRRSIGGKEYDIKAKAKLGGRVLIGQAKAWDSTVGAKELSEFVGSLDNEDIPDDAEGLFISLTDLTPQAHEFLSKLKRNKKERILTIVGDQIFDYLERIGFASIQEIKRRAKNYFQNKAGDTYFLVSNRGNFFIQLLVRHDETRPKAFCVFNSDCELISESEFGVLLQQHIEELRELTFLTHRGDFKSVLDLSIGSIGPGPDGANWFEYKLPAPPQYFIGRQKHIDHFQSFISDVQQDRINIRVYQVLSPSGVGKTSFMRKLQSSSVQPSYFEDARNFRSSVDLLVLMQEFLNSCKIALGVPETVPTDTASVLNRFSKVGRVLQKQRLVGIIFVDQFESLFLKSELYTQFLDLIARVTHDAKYVVFCIARRNDQPTTFDDRMSLDLQRLVGMSCSIELRDFSRSEVMELLSHLSDEIGQVAKQKLLNVALEFAASGYPWLCKRVGAHIRDAVVKKGITQETLIQSSISPEELFDEDLAELDIFDREFLKELAKYLPATLDDLSQKYDVKPLTTKLRMFHDMRLVRLIGRTYDTYSDLFKEYLKTGEVPLPTRYVFRSAPSTTKRVLDTIVKHNCKKVRDIAKLAGKISQDTVQNVLRELRLLELVETTRGNLKFDQEVSNAYQEGKLDSLLRERILRKNTLVREVLNRIAVQDQITFEQLTDYLKESLPVLDASDESWNDYTRLFVNWLSSFNLIRSKQVVMDTTSPTAKSDIYLPSVYISVLVLAMEKFRQKDSTKKTAISSQQLIDCMKLGLIEFDQSKDFLKITDLGRIFVSDPIERIKIIKNFLLSLPYVHYYMNFIEVSRRRNMDVFKQVIGNVGFTDETWLWRAKVFANWLEFANLVTRKSGWIQKSFQDSLFEESVH